MATKTKEDNYEEFVKIRNNILSINELIERTNEKSNSKEKDNLLKELNKSKLFLTNELQKNRYENSIIEKTEKERENNLYKTYQKIFPGTIINREKELEKFFDVNEIKTKLRGTETSLIPKGIEKEPITFKNTNKNNYDKLFDILNIIETNKQDFTKLVFKIKPTGHKETFYNNMTKYYIELYHDIINFLESFKTKNIFDKTIHEQYYDRNKNIIIEKIKSLFDYFNQNISIINNEPNIDNRDNMKKITQTINSSFLDIKSFLNHDYLTSNEKYLTGGKRRPIRSKKTRRNSTKKSKTARRRRNKKNVTNFR
jgi:hypothetical protein